LQSCLT